jgi:hypothetical protein
MPPRREAAYCYGGIASNYAYFYGGIGNANGEEGTGSGILDLNQGYLNDLCMSNCPQLCSTSPFSSSLKLTCWEWFRTIGYWTSQINSLVFLLLLTIVAITMK